MNNICYRNKGGIGNQLFIYFTAKAVSLKTNKKLLVDNSTGFYNDFYKRVPSLNYVVNDKFISANKLIKFLYKANKWIPAFLLNIIGIYTIIESNNREKVKIDYRKVAKYPLIIMEGYFQSYSYFDEMRDEILENIFTNFMVSKNYESFKESIETSDSVAIHIRRLQYDNILSLNYYLKAIKFIMLKIDNPRFFIFSDDIEWCKVNLNFDNITFIEVDVPDEIQELYLMSLSKSHIIANSSFSWWGAYISKFNNNIVIAPENNDIGVFDMFYPKSWILF